jgi:hypothetical protein
MAVHRFPRSALPGAALALLAATLIAIHAGNASQAERWAGEERTVVGRLESAEAEVSDARRELASIEEDLNSRRGTNRRVRSQVERQRDAIAVLEERVRKLGGDPDSMRGRSVLHS